MPKTPNFQNYTQILSIPITSMLTQKSLLHKTKIISKKCGLKKGEDEETLLTLSLMIRQKFEITHKLKEPNDTTEVYQQFCSMLDLPKNQGSQQLVLQTEAKELVKKKLDLVASMLSTKKGKVTKNQNKKNNNNNNNNKDKDKKAEDTSNQNQYELTQQKQNKQQLQTILDIVQQEQEKLLMIRRQAEAQQEAIMCEQKEQFFK